MLFRKGDVLQFNSRQSAYVERDGDKLVRPMFFKDGLGGHSPALQEAAAELGVVIEVFEPKAGFLGFSVQLKTKAREFALEDSDICFKYAAQHKGLVTAEIWAQPTPLQ